MLPKTQTCGGHILRERTGCETAAREASRGAVPRFPTLFHPSAQDLPVTESRGVTVRRPACASGLALQAEAVPWVARSPWPGARLQEAAWPGDSRRRFAVTPAVRGLRPPHVSPHETCRSSGLSVAGVWVGGCVSQTPPRPPTRHRAHGTSSGCGEHRSAWAWGLGCPCTCRVARPVAASCVFPRASDAFCSAGTVPCRSLTEPQTF